MLSLAIYAVMTVMNCAMAVGLWRGSARSRTAAIVVASAIALVLIVLLGNDVFRFVDHPEQFDPGQLLGWIGATVAGPGLILALLLPPASLRMTSAPDSRIAWPLRACALLLAAYAFLSAWVALVLIALLVEALLGLPGFRGANVGRGVVTVLLLLGYVALPVTATCAVLAAGLRRARAWSHIATIVGAGAIADLLVGATSSDVIRYTSYRDQFDLGRLLTEAALTLGGPGLILALLLPASLRMLAASLAGRPRLL